MKKVVIVGGGIVGLVLAKELASNGVDVTVYDRKEKAGENAAKASGILSKRGLERIGLNYKGASVNTLNGAILHAGKEKLEVFADGARAYVLDREKLEMASSKATEREGVEIVYGKMIGKRELREMKNVIVVGADGAVSSVASAFGFPPIDEHVLTYKATYSEATVKRRHIVEMFFNRFRFFGWSVPYGGDVIEVGVGGSNRMKRSSYDVFRDFIREKEVVGIVGKAKEESAYASIIPLGPRKITVRGNVLLVGDAAGQVKATTGGGIIFGASCAKIAAQTILANIERGRSLAAYEKDWRRAYGLDLNLHRAIHAFCSSLNTGSFEFVMKVLRAMGAESFFSKYGDMDRPSLMVKRFFLRSYGY
jgi:digeranylgeranylglycerophospholipid reductase